MNRKFAVLIIFFLIVGLETTTAFAKDNQKIDKELLQNRGNLNKSKMEIKINDKTETGSGSGEVKHKIKVNNEEFKIEGEITAVTSSNFVVAGQTIFLDPAQVSEFKQKGILAEGKKVKVEGIIKNGVKFAKEIKIIGDGQGRFKFEIKNAPNLPTSSLNLSKAPTLPTSSLTLGASPSADVKVRFKANGSVEQIKLFIQQILSFLQNLSA